MTYFEAVGPTGESNRTDEIRDAAELQQELHELKERLREANETIDALRLGEVDAIVVQSAVGPQIYTLSNDDRPYRRLIEQIGEGALTLTPEGIVLYCNSRTAEILRMPLAKVIGGDLRLMVAADDKDKFDRVLARGRGRCSLTLCAGDGSTLPVQLSVTELSSESTRTLCGVLSDLTEQKQALAALDAAHARILAEISEREEAEIRLHQLQKMEAIGQLTGGIAHDFNNLLLIVMGGLELIGRRAAELPPGPTTVSIRRGVELASKGADRGVSLIRRLLAFAHRQPLAPKPTDANELVANMVEMLTRTLGESVILETALAEGLWPTRADPNQIENAVLNLAVNARDAMPNGGRMTVRTENRTVDDDPEPCPPDGKPGDYVMIAVQDTGCGMDEATLERAFEPFFTTKGVGNGTGLGLSQVYGFAKQSEGHVKLRSKPDEGTTVEIYLPKLLPEQIPAATIGAGGESHGATDAGGGETVLVVEDNDDVRSYCVDALRELGYDVLHAADGRTALDMLDREPRTAIMFADIGLPGGMSGRQLATQALRRSAGLKVLLTSGYAHQADDATRSVDTDVEVLMKPFTFNALAERIRGIADRPPIALT